MQAVLSDTFVLTQKKRAARYEPAALRANLQPELLGSGLAEAIAEALNASTHVVHRLLGAGVERVRFAGGVKLDEWQVAAIFHLDHFLGVGARTGHELESIGHVLETNVAVIWVNACFHDFSISCGSRASLSGVLTAVSLRL
jgi:hypothetical protein